MSSEQRVKEKLDLLPVDLPYEIIANLRRLHSLFHEASNIDEAVPYSVTSVEDFAAAVQNLTPTKLQQALELVEEIQEKVIGTNNQGWSMPVLELLQNIYMMHFPPEKIDHRI